MRITLNLATRPFADLGPAMKRLRIAMAVLAVIGIGLGVGLHAIHRKAEVARARDHSLDGQIARITQERQRYTDLMRQPPNAQLLKQADVLNKLFDEKAFSWTLAMEDLETVLPGGVMVSTLEPARAKDGHITLHLRVIGPRDRAVDLVRNLEHSKHFLLPRIVSENAESTDRPGQQIEPVSVSDRVDFDLLADYKPATSEESNASTKPAGKSGDSEGLGRPASHSIHPLPSPAAGQGRPPYMGHSQPPNPRPLNPAPQNSGSLSSGPKTVAPMNPQPINPVSVSPAGSPAPSPAKPPPGGPN
jgi:type IV pilus assembly protein PilN